MSEKTGKDVYKSADELIKGLRDYSEEFIQDGLADIHKRVQNVVKYKQIDEEQDLHNPVYYRISNIRNMHKATTADYFDFSQRKDLGLKANIIGKISDMNGELSTLETEEDKDE
jgi:hypothetical protein